MASSARLNVPGIKGRFSVREEFPPEAIATAEAAAKRDPFEGPQPIERRDLRSVPFVTIDPETSRDLDQALFIERDAKRLLYAIADVGHFVEPGDPVELEAWKRGLTHYTPDGSIPLYPLSLSAGAASLLPDCDRPAIVFAFALDGEGRDTLEFVERAVVRSRAKLSYDQVCSYVDTGGPLGDYEWSSTLDALPVVGRRRQLLEIERGGVSLPIKEQHVERWEAALHGYRLTLRSPNDVEGYNAQVSLMTGMAAARLMVERGTGLLRVLGPPREDRLNALRLTAAALGSPWPADVSYGDFVRSLDPQVPTHVAILFHAAGALGGAGYRAIEGRPGFDMRHAAIGGFYAHTTAPLRRLCDRYVLDLVVDLMAGRPANPDNPLAPLESVMEAASRKARDLESAIVDSAEALLLSDRVGEKFEAMLVRVRGRSATLQLVDPPVRSDVALSIFGGDATVVDESSAIESQAGRFLLGETVTLRLDDADVEAGSLTFSLD